MKPEELQIGDWVLIDDEPKQIVQLTKSKVCYHIFPNNSRLNYARYYEVRPILITAEILEKNGFEFFKEHSNMWTCAIGTDWSIEVGLWQDMGMGTLIRCFKRESEGSNGIHLSYTPYVHQLQQA